MTEKSKDKALEFLEGRPADQELRTIKGTIDSLSNRLDFLEDGPTDEEIHAVKDIIRSFLIALKNYNLYPSRHVVCQKAFETVTAHLDVFLTRHGGLKLEVEKDSLLFRGQVVHQSSSTSAEENLAFPLFRDGIQSLHFQKGLEHQEIATFLLVLNRYWKACEESEGDIVTACRT